MSGVAWRLRSRAAVAVLAPVLALGGLTLVGSPTQAAPLCLATGSPQIRASATVPQGGGFELRGRGLYPCSSVEVYIGARNRQYLDDAATDHSGKFDDWVFVPSNLPVGTQVITVRDGSGAVYSTTIKVVRGGGIMTS